MTNRLIWGLYFDEHSEHINLNGTVPSIRFYTFINLHRLSINHAKTLGYDCSIYIPPHLHKYFDDLGIEVKNVTYGGNNFFDYVKNYILKVELGEYIIIDGDLILNKRLPSLSAHLLYEKQEPQSWKLFYRDEVNNLNRLGIHNIIPEWTGKKRLDIVNIGLLSVENEEFKNIWLDRWDKVKFFVESNITTNQIRYTPIAAQYMLTELIEYYNVDTKDFKTLSLPSTYTHYSGESKFTSSIVPDNRILKFNNYLI